MSEDNLNVIDICDGTLETKGYIQNILPVYFRYPLFTAIHKICKGEQKPQSFLDCLRDHPEHM